MTPYYQDDACTLYVGDCREVLPELAITPSVVIADPPYGETSLAWDRWPTGWIAALPVSVRQLWCFGSMRMFLEQRDEFTGWRYGQEVVWEKQNGSGFAADRFRRVHEMAAQWYRGSWPELTRNPQYTTGHARKVAAGGRTNFIAHTNKTLKVQAGYDSDERLVRSVIKCQNEQGTADHPTQKPLGILEPLIRYSTNPGDLILDPTAGAGSTLVAAKANGRRAIGIEADERYAEAAARRLSSTLDFGVA